MDYQKLLDDLLLSVPVKLLTDLIVEKFEAKGIKLSKKLKQKISLQIKNGKFDSISIKRFKWWEKQSIVLNINEEETDHIIKIIETLNKNLPNIILNLLNSIAPLIEKKLLDSSNKFLREEKCQRLGFEKKMWAIWKEPLSLLLLIIDLAERASENVNYYCRINTNDTPNLVEVLTRLHGRSVQVSQEIFILLKSGYADGAMARWRTLHEIAVVSCFISEKGEECAKGYLDHQHIENYHSAKSHQEHAERLGFERISDEEFGIILENSEEMIKQYGKIFKNEYGWAQPYIKSKGIPYFIDIEKAVDLYFLRPFYQFACHNIHADISGVFYKLGSPNVDSILAGPSVHGISEPGRKTGVTLGLLTSGLIQIFPSLDLLISMQVMSLVSQNACNAFSQTENSLIS
jgi:hypothetical protein